MENGFAVEVVNLDSLDQIKDRYQVPAMLESCHTAIVNGYVIEGHVPAAEIHKLLAEKPDVLGIAVAGMPVGSPGMETDDLAVEAFDVVTFDGSGRMEIYSSYPAE